MNNIKDIVNRYALCPKSYTIKGDVIVIETEEGRFVFKLNNGKNLGKLYDYLRSRSFYHFQPLVNMDERYSIHDYVEEVEMPTEQKALDLMLVLSSLHNKTTYYQEVTFDDYKKIYEELTEQIKDYYDYYHYLIEEIETKVYMSPAQYLLARNINKIYGSLSFCQHELNYWYDLIKDKKKQRVVILHNNLEIDHLLHDDKMYLISWDHYQIGMPIYDLYYFYQKHYHELAFYELFKAYESKYPLLEEERKLLFILLALPSKAAFNNNQFLNCQTVSKRLEYIYKTEKLILDYNTTDKVE